MAKKVVATLQKKDGKGVTKVVKMVKSPKTGAYIFKEKTELGYIGEVEKNIIKK